MVRVKVLLASAALSCLLVATQSSTDAVAETKEATQQEKVETEGQMQGQWNKNVPTAPPTKAAITPK